jgi:hypothetical protein
LRSVMSRVIVIISSILPVSVASYGFSLQVN